MPRYLVSGDQLTAIREHLTELAANPPTHYTLQRAVKEALPEIEVLVRKGYTWESLATAFSKKGPPIRPHTLRQYVDVARAEIKAEAAAETAKPPKTTPQRDAIEVEKRKPGRPRKNTADGELGTKVGARTKIKNAKVATAAQSESDTFSASLDVSSEAAASQTGQDTASTDYRKKTDSGVATSGGLSHDLPPGDDVRTTTLSADTEELSTSRAGTADNSTATSSNRKKVKTEIYILPARKNQILSLKQLQGRKFPDICYNDDKDYYTSKLNEKDVIDLAAQHRIEIVIFHSVSELERWREDNELRD